ncbi:type 1 glutamine amidotransferase [Shewanella sp. 10N.286.54.B9]|uniref:type 1 glutamine amidotransferase n=1 Tax=Shewanella sp. 10N.286.54.B9 TaxID=3229719 RepID=UPI00354FD4C0
MPPLTLAVIQHHTAEDIGRISRWADGHQHQLQTFYAPENRLPNLDIFDGLIILGGPMNVADNPIWMQREREVITCAINRNMPVLAICLGAQLLASSLGAKIYPLSSAELGWKPIHFKTAKFPSMIVPQWHEQGFIFDKQKSTSLSIDIEACSSLCKQQIFRHQRQLGMQFHPEWDEPQIQKLRAAFSTECPFHDINNSQRQNILEQWLFKELDQLFGEIS